MEQNQKEIELTLDTDTLLEQLGEAKAVLCSYSLALDDDGSLMYQEDVKHLISNVIRNVIDAKKIVQLHHEKLIELS